MKAMSKASSDINQPVAAFEMNLSQNKVAKFDMTREEVGSMVETLSGVQAALDSLLAAK
jgi:hypothetical protein